jgi:type 1 fimbriae regulatory protein FimB/type 1 fimbriae regulatory protein FimE
MRGSNRRQYFTESELARLIKAAKDGRYGHRDSTLILLMARHGLRVSEAVDLEWSQIDFTRAHLHRATPEGRDRVGASDPGRRVAGVARTASPIDRGVRVRQRARRANDGFNVSKMVEAAGNRERMECESVQRVLEVTTLGAATAFRRKF